jgi:hypothetical protein
MIAIPQPFIAVRIAEQRRRDLMLAAGKQIGEPAPTGRALRLVLGQGWRRFSGFSRARKRREHFGKVVHVDPVTQCE